jgi:hypothetical protein
MVEPGAQHHGRRGPDVRNGCACRLASIVFSRLYQELAKVGKSTLAALQALWFRLWQDARWDILSIVHLREENNAGIPVQSIETR